MKKICSITLVLSLLFTLLSGVTHGAGASASAASGDIILVDEDFSSGFTVNQAYTAGEMETLSEDLIFATGMLTNSFPDKTTAHYTVKQKDANDASKGNYLEIGAHKNDSNAVVAADFDDITTGTVVVEMKIRPSAGTKTKYYNRMVAADKVSKDTLYGVNTSDTKVWSYGIFENYHISLTPSTENGFCSVKTVWSRANATDNWSVDMYDMIANPNTKLISYEAKGNQTLDSSFVPTGVEFYNSYQQSANAKISIDIADLKVYIPAPVTLDANGEYDAGNKTISFTTSDALDEETFTSSMVTVTNSAGETVAATSTYANGVITVKTDARLRSGQYTVMVNGAKKATDGSLVSGATGVFTVERVGDIVLVDEDFSTGFTVNQAYTAAEMEALSEDLIFATGMLTNSFPDKTTAHYTVKQKDANDASKGNYLEIGAHKNDSNAVVAADFDDITTGTVVVEMKMRPSVGKKTKYYNRMVAADKVYKDTLYGVNGSDTKVWSYGIFPSWSVSLTPSTEDGFCSVKTVWSRANVTDNWTVDMYDMVANPNTKLISYTTGGDQTLDSSFVPTGFEFYNSWQLSTDAQVSVDIADLKVYIPASEQEDALENVVFTSGGQRVDSLALTATDLAVTTDVRTADANASYVLVLAVYSSDDNRLLAVDCSAEGTTDANGEATGVTASVSGLSLSKSAYAKVFLWENMTTMKPLVGDPEVLPAAGF